MTDQLQEGGWSLLSLTNELDGVLVNVCGGRRSGRRHGHQQRGQGVAVVRCLELRSDVVSDHIEGVHGRGTRQRKQVLETEERTFGTRSGNAAEGAEDYRRRRRPACRSVVALCVADDPAVEEPVMEESVPPGLVDTGLDTAECPETPEVDDPNGQGLSQTPEGASGSLPCGQRVVTPESSDSDSSFEVISDTESDNRPACRTAPAPVIFGTLGGIPGTSTERPLLRFEDLFALARSAPVYTFDVSSRFWTVRQYLSLIHI